MSEESIEIRFAVTRRQAAFLDAMSCSRHMTRNDYVKFLINLDEKESVHQATVLARLGLIQGLVVEQAGK